MDINININAPELAAAINSLALSIGKAPVLNAKSCVHASKEEADKSAEITAQTANNPAPAQQPAPMQQAPIQQPAQQQAPAPVPTAPPVQQAPVQQPQQPQPVPTTAPTYDMNQLAVAATQLMDAGKQPELLQLLSSFGVQALMQLDQAQYGAFATKLRELGAKL